MRGSERQALSRLQRRALDRLLTEYLEQAAGDRVAFLRRCHQRWPRLARWLEELVSAERGITLTLLDKPLRGVGDQAMERIEQCEDNRLDSGYRLGPWRIIELAGEGGLGKVYRGERADGAFEKTVAIKLLRLRGAGLGEQLQRECRLLARLDHPAISGLLDAGLDEQAGPFLVMEWIEGQDLSDWIGDHPSGVQCLDVMMSLCEAVDHAHRQLIIHGDIKPGNVRLDSQGRVKLLDFGNARLVGGAEDHPASIAALTPTFAPPEQHRGEPLDARSDVWALGALLAWLLRGGRLRAKTEHADSLPVATETIHDAELRAVIDKACAEKPEQRYPSARELLADLQRYRQHRPLQAMPSTAAYRVRKFMRRNPVLVGGITATTGALVAGLVTTSIWFLEARHKAAELVNVVEFQAEHLAGLEAAEMGAAMRRDLLDQRREVLVSSGLPAMEVEAELAALDEALAGVNFTNTALATLDSGIFDRARETIDHRFVDQPRVRASLLQTLASTLRQVGLLTQAELPQEVALALRTEVLGGQDPATLESIHESAVLAHALADYDSAQARLEQVLEERRHVLGARHPDTLESAHALAEVLRRQGQYPQAEALAREVLHKRREGLGREHSDTVRSLAELGAAIRSQGRLSEAEPYYRQVAEQRERLLGPGHPDTLEAMNNLGLLLVRMDRYAEAESLYIKTLERRQRVLGDNHPSTLVSLNNLAALMRLTERYDRAEMYYLDAIERAGRVFGDHNLETANLFNNLGVLYRHMERLGASKRFLQRALEARTLARGPTHRATLTAKHNLARTLYEKGQLDDAEHLQARAVAGIKRTVSADHWYRGAFLGNYGRILMAQEKFARAESALSTARKIHVNALGPSHHRVTEVTRVLAELYRQWAVSEPDAGHEDSRADWLAQLEPISAQDDR